MTTVGMAIAGQCFGFIYIFHQSFIIYAAMDKYSSNMRDTFFLMKACFLFPKILSLDYLGESKAETHPIIFPYSLPGP